MALKAPGNTNDRLKLASSQFKILYGSLTLPGDTGDPLSPAGTGHRELMMKTRPDSPQLIMSILLSSVTFNQLFSLSMFYVN